MCVCVVSNGCDSRLIETGKLSTKKKKKDTGKQKTKRVICKYQDQTFYNCIMYVCMYVTAIGRQSKKLALSKHQYREHHYLNLILNYRDREFYFLLLREAKLKL